MNSKSRFYSIVTTVVFVGLTMPLVWSTEIEIGAKSDLHIMPTALFHVGPAAGLTPINFLAYTGVSPDAQMSARVAAAEMSKQEPVIVLQRGQDVAILPQAFTRGSPSVLVNAQGAAAPLVLHSDTVAKLAEHLKNGNVGFAYQALLAQFDGSKSENPELNVPSELKPGEKKQALQTSPVVSALNHVAIHVIDVEKSMEFYRDILGLRPLPRPAFPFAGAWFRLGTDQELHIIGGRTEPVYSDSRGNHFALEVPNFDPWLQHFEKLHITYRPPKIRPDGARQIFIRDPDGHLIELYEPASKKHA